MQILRQSTAVDVRLGPFVDVTDGFTPETGVTIAASDEAEILKHDGAATVSMAGTLAAVTGCDGWYDYTMSTSDTDTVGLLTIVMQDDSVYLPVFANFYVVEEAVYDSLFASSAAGPLQSTVSGRKLDVTATGAAGIDWGNVENETTTLDLSNTSINLCDTTTAVTNGVTLAGTATSSQLVTDILTSQMTESYAADGSAPTVSQSLMLIQQILGDFSISGTTLTVRKIDGSTTASTFTLNDASTPTSITRAT